MIVPEVETVSCDVPEPATDAGLNEQLAVLGSPEQASVTVPLNPPTAVIVTVEVAEPPAGSVAGESAVAVIWKSGFVWLAGEDPPPHAFSPTNGPAMASSHRSNRINCFPGISPSPNDCRLVKPHPATPRKFLHSLFI